VEPSPIEGKSTPKKKSLRRHRHISPVRVARLTLPSKNPPLHDFSAAAFFSMIDGIDYTDTVHEPMPFAPAGGFKIDDDAARIYFDKSDDEWQAANPSPTDFECAFTI
jgi:hypothetical protein